MFIRTFLSKHTDRIFLCPSVFTFLTFFHHFSWTIDQGGTYYLCYFHFGIFTVKCCTDLNFFVLNFSYLNPEVLLFILSSVIDVTDFCDSVDRIYLRVCWMAHFTESNINKRVHPLGDMGLEVNGC